MSKPGWDDTRGWFWLGGDIDRIRVGDVVLYGLTMPPMAALVTEITEHQIFTGSSFPLFRDQIVGVRHQNPAEVLP